MKAIEKPEASLIVSTESNTPLTATEAQQLSECEQIIRTGLRSAVQARKALVKIRDQRLFRSTHASFEAYCRDKWNFTGRQGNRLIGAGAVIETLLQDQLVSAEPVAIPENEAQARPMTKLTPPQMLEAAKIAAKKADKPTAKHFAEATEEVAGKKPKAGKTKDYEEDKPRIESYDPRNDVEAEAEKKTEMKSAKVAAPVTIDDGMVSLKDLLALAVLAYNTFSNSSKSKDVEKMLWKLKEGLREWADWHVNQLNQEVA